MDTVSLVLGVLAGGLQLFGYFLYAKKVKKPNASSWGIWAFAAFLDLGSYAAMTGDWVKNILPAACAIASIYIFAKGLVQKQFERPDKKDIVVLGADVGITGIWFFTNATVANILYQFTTGLSFIPIIRWIRKDKSDEHWFPWAIWTAAYTFFFCSVLLRLEAIEELLYPTVSVATHAIVWAILWKKRDKKTPT